MNDTKTVFISYSWDSEAHKDWVRTLAERLMANGVHVHLDQWDVRPGDSLTQFMDMNLPIANFSLVICTPEYAKKSVNRDGGAGYEAQIITARIAAGIERSRFVPLIRAGSMKPVDAQYAIPPHFAGIFTLDMRDDESIDQAFEDLLRHIYDQPALRRPPLGNKPDFVGLGVAETRAATRLASLEIEHWELASGVVRNQLHPQTFQIPDEASRRTVEPGDVVKLAFEYIYEEEDDDDDFQASGERMWVKVTDTDGPYYIGTLANVPVCTTEWHSLDFGDTIVFLPEHIISLDRGGEDNERARQHDLELQSIIEDFLQASALTEVVVDDVMLILKRLEDESDGHPDKDHLEVWETIRGRLNLGEKEFSVAKAIWQFSHDESEDEVAT